MSSLTDSKNPADYAEKFANSKLIGDRYLAMRDLPQLINEHISGTKILDYGCGTGISTNFVKKPGLKVHGVDISTHMIEKAKEIDPIGNYWHIESGVVPAENEYYDLVFSCLVFMFVATKGEMLKILKEINRILKQNGYFMLTVATEELYNFDWSTVSAKFEENENLSRGALAKVILEDMNLLLHLHYWTETDYREVCEQSGFIIEKAIHPLGRDDDEFKTWSVEKDISPFLTLVMRKKQEAKM